MRQNEPTDEKFEDYVGETYEVPEEPNAIVEVKVSGDGGETWTRREINLGGDIDESGLNEGEIFQLSGDKYRVVYGDFGLMIESLDRKKSSKRK